MKRILILVSFLSLNGFSSSFKELCSEWQKIKLKEIEVKRWNQQNLLATWMESKEIFSSEFLIISEKDEKEKCSVRVYKTAIF